MNKKEIMILAALGLAVYAVASRRAGEPTYTVLPGGSTLDYTSSDGNIDLTINQQIVNSIGAKGFEYSLFMFNATQNKLVNVLTDTVVAGDQSSTYDLGTAALVVTNNNNGTVNFDVYSKGSAPRNLFSKTLTYQGGLA